MLDLELLRSFVSVVDAGGFTRAGERVHRTQSTVSQQIKRLEEDVGQPLLNRSGKDATPTESRRAAAAPMRGGCCRWPKKPATSWRGRAMKARSRLGVPEDFAAYRLAKLLSSFRARVPRCGSTCAPIRAPICSAISSAANSDLALFKRARWRKRRHRGVAGASCTGSPAERIRDRYAHAARCR